jgi:hypothetical protein
MQAFCYKGPIRAPGQSHRLGLALWCGAEPKTVTSALAWLQQDQQDWSDDYRLFSQTQWDPKMLLANTLATFDP